MKSSKPREPTAAVLYIRTYQEDPDNPIQAQLGFLQRYARRHAIICVKVYFDIQSARIECGAKGKNA